MSSADEPNLERRVAGARLPIEALSSTDEAQQQVATPEDRSQRVRGIAIAFGRRRSADDEPTPSSRWFGGQQPQAADGESSAA